MMPAPRRVNLLADRPLSVAEARALKREKNARYFAKHGAEINLRKRIKVVRRKIASIERGYLALAEMRAQLAMLEAQAGKG